MIPTQKEADFLYKRFLAVSEPYQVAVVLNGALALLCPADLDGTAQVVFGGGVHVSSTTLGEMGSPCGVTRNRCV